MARIRTWEISDEFWALVESLLPKTRRDPARSYKRKPGGGRKQVYSDRLFFEGIVYVLRTGIIWNAFPREKFKGLGSSALHKRFRSGPAGLFEAIWRRGSPRRARARLGMAVADGRTLKRRWPGIRRAEPGQGKKGTKRHILVDGRGVPLSIVVTGMRS